MGLGRKVQTMDPIQEAVEKMCNALSQDVSYKFGDMVIGYPHFLRYIIFFVPRLFNL